MTRTPGRRPLDPRDPSVAVTIRMPAKAFEAVCRRAAAARVTVPELIRRAIRPGEKDSKLPAP